MHFLDLIAALDAGTLGTAKTLTDVRAPAAGRSAPVVASFAPTLETLPSVPSVAPCDALDAPDAGACPMLDATDDIDTEPLLFAGESIDVDRFSIGSVDFDLL